MRPLVPLKGFALCHAFSRSWLQSLPCVDLQSHHVSPKSKSALDPHQQHVIATSALDMLTVDFDQGVDRVDFFNPGVSYLVFRHDSIFVDCFSYFVSKWLKLRSFTPFMLLWMVETILFGLNLCAASLKVKNYGFMSLVRWRSQPRALLRMTMFLGFVWLNGIVTIIRFLLGYAILPSHPSLICWEVLMMLALPGICLPNDIPPHMAFRNISSRLNNIRLGKTWPIYQWFLCSFPVHMGPTWSCWSIMGYSQWCNEVCYPTWSNASLPISYGLTWWLWACLWSVALPDTHSIFRRSTQWTFSWGDSSTDPTSSE